MSKSIFIDGREFAIDGTKTVLRIARENGIYIPSLCYHPKLGPASMCRICVVEVDGTRNLQTACAMIPSDGMKIYTDTKRVIDARKMVVNMLLANGNHNCISCERNGDPLTTGQVSGTLPGDLMMLAAVILCGLGYAEGGRLSRRLGGWQVISWSLLMTLPLMLPLTLVEWPKNLMTVSPPSVFALLYVGLFSMLIGFIFWYRGLAQGGIASIGQLQFLQPFLGLAFAAAILGESIGWSLLVVMVLVIGCVAAARRFA